MTISIEFAKVYKNVYTYYIYKNGEKIGELEYNEITDVCKVTDQATEKIAILKDTSVYECVSEIAQAFYEHYDSAKVYLETYLVNW